MHSSLPPGFDVGPSLPPEDQEKLVECPKCYSRAINHDSSNCEFDPDGFPWGTGADIP